MTLISVRMLYWITCTVSSVENLDMLKYRIKKIEIGFFSYNELCM